MYLNRFSVYIIIKSVCFIGEKLRKLFSAIRLGKPMSKYFFTKEKLKRKQHTNGTSKQKQENN